MLLRIPTKVLILVVQHVPVDKPGRIRQQKHVHRDDQPQALMLQLLQDHQLVQGDKQVGQVDAERDFEPRFVVPTVGLGMVHCKREKHDEDADAGPHYLEELDALSLHLLLPPLHAEVLEPRPLHVHRALLEGYVPRRSHHASLASWHHLHLSSLHILLVL